MGVQGGAIRASGLHREEKFVLAEGMTAECVTLGGRQWPAGCTWFWFPNGEDYRKAIQH